jgi:hypothetical protein
MISSGFAALLAERRVEFNRRFDEISVQFNALTPEVGAEFFTRDLQPVIIAAEAVLTDTQRSAGRLFDIADTAVRVGLRATVQRMLGPTASQQHVTALWHEALPQLARLLVIDPTLISALTTAAWQVASFEEARPAQWLRLLRTVGEHCADPTELRRVGQVAAWRSGLAHYRESALSVLDHLSPQRSMQVLDLGPVIGRQPPPWEATRARLHSDRWWNGAHGSEADSGDFARDNEWKVVQQGGSFVGFGGRFQSPPRLQRLGSELFAVVDNDVFLVSADGFGVTFHRHRAQLPPRWQFDVEPDATLDHVGQALSHSQVLQGSAPATSGVESNGALAVSTAHSHAIVFLRRGG